MRSQSDQDGYIDPSLLNFQLVQEDGEDVADRCRPGEVVDEEKEVLCPIQQR
jgi:hypothetical protein